MGQAVYDAEALIANYERLIRKMGAQCYRKLPPGSMYDRDDLYQEGRIRALRVAERYDPTRGAKFMTLLTVALRNRYTNILAEEWRRCPTRRVSVERVKSSETDGRTGQRRTRTDFILPDLPSQRAVEAAMGLEIREAHLKDRYGRLRRQRWLVSAPGGQAVLVRKVGDLQAMLAQLPARVRVPRTPMARVGHDSHVSHGAGV